MIEGMNYQKEKRKKRLAQNTRRKAAAAHEYQKNRRHTKFFSYEDQDLDNRDLINTR